MSYLDDEPRHGRSFGAVLAGYGVSRFLGGNIWLPMLIALGCQLGIRKLRPAAAEPVRWAAAITLGQCLWMLVAGLLMPAKMGMVLPDIVLGSALAGWLIWRLSRFSVVLLLVLHAVGFAVNMWGAFQLAAWGPDMIGIVSNLLLRAAIIGFGIHALAAGTRREEISEDEADEVFA